MLTEYLVRIALFGAEWVLYLLLILSVLSVATMVERIVVFVRARARLKELEDVALAGRGRMTLDDTHAEDRLLKLVDGWDTAEEAGGEWLVGQVEGLSNAYRRGLERFLPFLGTMGNNAPFIGLFGTVIGVIQAFAQLGDNPEGGAGMVMGGISEALVATGAGLAVAIPAVIAYNFFNRTVDGATDRFVALIWSRIRTRGL